MTGYKVLNRAYDELRSIGWHPHVVYQPNGWAVAPLYTIGLFHFEDYAHALDWVRLMGLENSQWVEIWECETKNSRLYIKSGLDAEFIPNGSWLADEIKITKRVYPDGNGTHIGRL